jgi:acylphosphatase
LDERLDVVTRGLRRDGGDVLLARMKSSYSTDIEGGAPVRLRYSIAGHMRVEEYLAFVSERARWFGISGWVRAEGDEITLVAAGPEAMVGALEMACILGPINALIERVVGIDETGPVEAGFEIRQK